MITWQILLWKILRHCWVPSHVVEYEQCAQIVKVVNDDGIWYIDKDKQVIDISLIASNIVEGQIGGVER